LIAVWELETGERVGDDRIGHFAHINGLAVSEDGRQVLTLGTEGLAIRAIAR
jgi:hypothetical protein